MAGGKKSEEELNDLVDEITVDAYNDDEQLWAFRQVIEDEVAMPADAFALGEPVTRHRDRLRRERAAGAHGEVPAGGRLRARRLRERSCLPGRIDWQPTTWPPTARGSASSHTLRLPLRKKPKATEDEIDMTQGRPLVALAVKGNAVSCRILGTEHVLTLRPSGFWEAMPGEIVTVIPAQEVALWGSPLPCR